MIPFIRKRIFKDSGKNQSAPYIFIILCIYTVIMLVYNYMLFGAATMLIRLVMGVAMILIFVLAERSRLNITVTAYISPTLIIAILIFGAVYFKGDGLIFYYVSCIAMISLSYFSAKALASHIMTVTAAICVILFAFGVNLLGAANYSFIYNIISFLASIGLCALAYSFCVFSIGMMSALERNKNLMLTENLVAETLLSKTGSANIEDSLSDSMRLLGQAVDADHVHVWRNEMVGGDMHFTHAYQWLSEAGPSLQPLPIGLSFAYKDMPEWDKLFMQGGYINSPVSRMSETDKAIYEGYGFKSIVILPLHLQNEQFWGLFSIYDCRNERVFTEDEINIIRSAALLITNAHEMQNALESATTANHAKSAFLSTVSHEIRTPMNAILGITEIQFQNESLEPSVLEAFEKINTSGNLLLGIINDILDLSKIEAGKLEVMPASYDVASLINDSVQLNIMRIGGKPITFELSVAEDMPAHLIGDELRVKQIINNLLSNAFKYTSEGTVKLLVFPERRRQEDRDDEIMIAFRVSDTGQGMTEDQISKLFDEYSRFNQEANRKTEGTGLGMNITRNLIRMMNGKIEIESKPGKGSVFTAHIPQGKTDSGVLGKELAGNLQQFKVHSGAHSKRTQINREYMPYGSVLIVDDVETNIYVAKGLMTAYGLKIDSANSGQGAIDKVKAGNTYDIIFMDHMMPEMDGIEAAKHIRDMKYEGFVIALTANAIAGQAEVFLNNGFNDFISKPIDVRQLNSILNKHIRDKQPPEIIAEARKQAEERREQLAETVIDSEFAEIFVRDAHKSLATLDTVMAGELDEEALRAYVIHTHGMKSALANIGKTELSVYAMKLEQAGRSGNKDVIRSDTPAFLEALKAFIAELIPENLNGNIAGEPADEDRAYLNERLAAVKTACEEYNENEADDILAELKSKAWSQEIKEFLSTVSEFLLHSDFDEIIVSINDYVNKNY